MERQQANPALAREGGSRGAFQDAQRSARRVVPDQLSRGQRALGGARDVEGTAERGLELLAGDPAGPQDHRRVRGQGQDRGFQTDAAGAAVEHEVDGAAELSHHVLGPGSARGPDQRARRRVAGDAHADRLEARGHEVGHRGLPRQDEGERPGPEALGERRDARIRRPRRVRETSHPDHVLGAGHVDDERVERRAGLHREHAGDGPGVERIGPQAVDGLGGEGDQASRAEEAGRLLDGVGIVRRQHASGQGASAAAGRTTWPPRRNEASMPQAAWMSGPPE